MARVRAREGQHLPGENGRQMQLKISFIFITFMEVVMRACVVFRKGAHSKFLR